MAKEDYHQSTGRLWRLEPADDETVISKQLEWLAARLPASSIVRPFREVTKEFLSDARERLEFMAFRAVTDTNDTLGTVCCQAWSGVVPLVVQPTTFKPGSVWGLTLSPHLPPALAEEIAAALLQRALEHLGSAASARGAEPHRLDRLPASPDHARRPSRGERL